MINQLSKLVNTETAGKILTHLDIPLPQLMIYTVIIAIDELIYNNIYI